MSAKGFLSSPAATVEQAVAWLHSRVSLTAHLKLDSREIEPGDVFVACPGLSSDGRLYIEKALALGASAVLFEAPATAAIEAAAAAGDTPMLPVTGLRALLGELGDTWYGRPSSTLAVVAVTGTNGKTSSVQWIAHALGRNDKPCGTIGTLGAVLPDGQTLGGHLTTPDVLTVHRLLAAMRDAGAKAVAMEASSIGIEQGRMDGVRVALAAYTNLTRDHLDYHGTMERYEAAKASLFRWPGLSAAVVNADDEAGRRLIASLPADLSVMGYSLSADPAIPAAMRARDLQATAQGQIFTLVSPHGEAQIVTRLLGAHNVSNLLLVAGVLYKLGLPFAQIARELAATDPVDGRLQTVEPVAASTQAHAGRGALVVVDYSHTPDSLARALMALRPVAHARAGRLVCVFGCGGDRDAGKRPEMGRIAAELADHVVVSSDNPRSESPDAIVAQILAGIPASVAVEVQVDRARAIMQAIWASAPEDVVLLAGKGHETYQEIAGEKLPFDDREWARLALLLPLVKGVSTDTRRIGAGELFVALVGENFDAHNYLDQAAERGACAAVVAHAVPESSLPQLVLGDTRVALMRIGAAWRARFKLPVVAVTGSNGKTTTKEMISAMLAGWRGEAGRLATAGNLNNDIGVPLTVLRLRPEHRAAVFELGMNHPGEIAQLAAIAAPSVALVTNAQREHQEFMHTVEAVALENGAAIAALPADGVAVYPGDEPYAAIWDRLAAPRRALRFGLQPGLDVYAEQILADVDSTRCRVVTPVGSADLTLPVPGVHNLRNALAAIASAIAAGAPLDVAVRALAGFSPVAGRMQYKKLSDGTLLVDDTYNANPDSVRAAIDVLARIAGTRVLVLGDMGEVGDNGPAMHEEVGNYARELGLDALITLGDASRAAAAAFGTGAHACASVDEVVAALRGLRASCVLIKGSRFMRMERVVTAFISNDGQASKGQGTTMLLEIARLLSDDVRALGVFEYITLRAVLACATALLIGLVAGPRVIRKLTEMKIGQAVRSYGPESHLVKTGTPTMGGVLILISIAISTLLWADWTNRFVWVVLLVTFGFGWIGWMDDYRKVVYRDPEGMPARQKFFWQASIGLVAAVYLAFAVSAPANTELWPLFKAWVGSGFTMSLPTRADLIVPFFKTVSYPLGVLGFVALTWAVIVGTSNAVNLTDGLDGLAIMPTVMVGSALGIFAYVVGRVDYSKYLLFPYIPGASELMVLCAAIGGAGLAFLWFNAYPAQVFMGDVGALALGGALGTIAVIVRQEIVLFIMGGVFVVETLSVMIQVTWFKYTKRRYGTGRRIFRMAPLHHHFEVGGWKETQVVVRFWIISMMLVLIGLSTLKLR